MLVGEGREVAREWVLGEGARLPGFRGAFLTGSTLWARPDDVLADSSDVDVMVVRDPSAPPVGLGKFRHRGVLLEVSCMPDDGPLRSPEAVLGDYHLAGSFHLPGVLADPTGRLTVIQESVARHFGERRWVLARSRQALDRVRHLLAAMDESAPPADQVTTWLFGTGVMTHVLLVAGLRNPTIRRRYEAVRRLLAEHDRLAYHETLLGLLGCAELTPDRAEHHLTALEAVFDAAKDVLAPSYRFSSDVSDEARAVSIGGSRELIRRGLHRESVFWLVATHARCLAKLSAAGAPLPEDAFLELLADLGAETFAARRHRAGQVLDALPELWRQAEALAPDPDA
ncbi:hypothetical protein ABT294_41890 [Nonomuraea sp. NPDC000554]|uniref:hypothetical protein n=1 Tax=Nonomuraea sp. NPDC000554 TaxID=3154259 RepID=UPI00331E9462